MSRFFSEPLQQIDRIFVLWRGRKLSYFGGCDYFRLSSHPEVLDAVESGLKSWGLNVSASRATTGNHALYEKLEETAAAFFASESAILTSNGYLTNLAAAQGLRGRVDLAIMDEQAHPSLKDAAQFLGCPLVSFQHLNPFAIEAILQDRPSETRIALLTDGMFANDGSIAPLAQYRRLLGSAPLLWVDDSHSAGILGENGRGSVEHAGVSRQNLLQTITFSKAFGAYGGAILTDTEHAGEIATKSTALVGNTPLPLPLANAALVSLNLLRREPAFRQRLAENIEAFWRFMEKPVATSPSPIIAATSENPAALQTKLLDAEIHPPFIHYPGGPASGYFRFALSSEHGTNQIRALAEVLRSFSGDINLSLALQDS